MVRHDQEIDFDVNRRAESEIQGLSRNLNLLDEKVDDPGNLLRVTRVG
jgi:CRP/FNR family transcriptional regulator, cyclic AMP receptor protein